MSDDEKLGEKVDETDHGQDIRKTDSPEDIEMSGPIDEGYLDIMEHWAESGELPPNVDVREPGEGDVVFTRRPLRYTLVQHTMDEMTPRKCKLPVPVVKHERDDGSADWQVIDEQHKAAALRVSKTDGPLKLYVCEVKGAPPEKGRPKGLKKVVAEKSIKHQG